MFKEKAKPARQKTGPGPGKMRKDVKGKKEKPPPAGRYDDFIKTGIQGLDNLFERGVPKNASVLIAGGAGSGKTILCLQMVYRAALEDRKCLYMSFEESEERLKSHMKMFGWNLGDKGGNLMIKKMDIFSMGRSIDAMLAKKSGELLIDVKPVLMPDGFTPDIVVVDSLTSIASALTDSEGIYRIYIEQFFRYFEEMKVNTFLISETSEEPEVYSPMGVEEFLADGVIVLYNIRKGNTRENGIEVLKMRGAKHEKKIAAMQITDNGIEVYPDQEVFGIEK